MVRFKTVLKTQAQCAIMINSETPKHRLKGETTVSSTPNKETMRKKVDLGAKKTEAEWQETIDDFWKRVTPLWFQWLEWLLILGVVAYLAKQTQTVVLKLVSGLSYAMLFLYLQALFYSVEFYGFPLIKSERVRRIASLILSAALSIALWLLFKSFVSAIQGKV